MVELLPDDREQPLMPDAVPVSADQRRTIWQRVRDAFVRPETDLTLANQTANDLILQLRRRGLDVSGISESGAVVKIYLNVDGRLELFPNPITVFEDGSIMMPPHQGMWARAALDEPVNAAIQSLGPARSALESPVNAA